MMEEVGGGDTIASFPPLIFLLSFRSIPKFNDPLNMHASAFGSWVLHLLPCLFFSLFRLLPLPLPLPTKRTKKRRDVERLWCRTNRVVGHAVHFAQRSVTMAVHEISSFSSLLSFSLSLFLPRSSFSSHPHISFSTLWS